jgi:hypothetical protein
MSAFWPNEDRGVARGTAAINRWSAGLSVVAGLDGPYPARASKAECRAKHEMGFGAGDGSRTRDIQLGRPKRACAVGSLVEGRA